MGKTIYLTQVVPPDENGKGGRMRTVDAGEYVPEKHGPVVLRTEELDTVLTTIKGAEIIVNASDYDPETYGPILARNPGRPNEEVLVSEGGEDAAETPDTDESQQEGEAAPEGTDAEATQAEATAEKPETKKSSTKASRK